MITREELRRIRERAKTCNHTSFDVELLCDVVERMQCDIERTKGLVEDMRKVVTR